MDLQLVSAHKLDQNLLDEVTEFLDNQHSTHPYQYPAWAPLNLLRSKNYCVLVRDGKQIRLFARCATIQPLGRLFPRPRGLVINRGPVCDDVELMLFSLTKLVSRARQLGFAYVEISPDYAGGEADRLGSELERTEWARFGGPRLSLRSDLVPPAESIFENFRKTTRYEVRRAERDGVRVTAATREEECGAFLKLYEEMADQKNFLSDKPADIMHVVRTLLIGSKRGALLVASYQGTIRGGIVIVRAGSRCWYVWGATSKDATVHVGHILQWHGILWAKENGCSQYDFGGYTEGATTGPAHFKRGFSNNVIRFLDARRRVVDPLQYRYCELVWGGRQRISALVP